MRHNRPRPEIWYVVRFFSLYLLRHHPLFHCHCHNFLWLIGVVNVTVNCCIWNELMFKKESMIKVSQLKDFPSLSTICGVRGAGGSYKRISQAPVENFVYYNETFYLNHRQTRTAVRCWFATRRLAPSLFAINVNILNPSQNSSK